ncbi:hypothetical protein [Paenibacillus dakarensis]|uniref:hypothetical protein n=1 Tax=Paenibacillus dakarensis TaxID=1527293 RepID=UPI000A6F1908|nr:hypothetical protein [Paenibacillus dakarensis]
MMDLKTNVHKWRYYAAQQHENKYVQDTTNYLLDKSALNKIIAMWSKQTKEEWRMEK